MSSQLYRPLKLIKNWFFDVFENSQLQVILWLHDFFHEIQQSSWCTISIWKNIHLILMAPGKKALKVARSVNFHKIFIFQKSQNSCLKEYNSICKNYGKQKFLLLGPAPFLEKLALKVCLTILVYYALKRNHVTKE